MPSIVFIIVLIFVDFFASILISMPFGYRYAGEVFVAILLFMAIVGFIRWLRSSQRNPWDDPRVEDARSAMILGKWGKS